MNTTLKIFTILLFALFFQNAIGQTNNGVVSDVSKNKIEIPKRKTFPKKTVKRYKTPELDINQSIGEQYDFIIQKSNKYKGSRVIKIKWLDAFYKTITDTINELKSKNTNLSNSLKNIKKETAKLKAENLANNEKINMINENRFEVSLFGMKMQRRTHDFILWSVISVLLIISMIVVVIFKRNNHITIETKQRIKEIEEDFDRHRKNALVREQKLARKLQDEVIKNKKLGLQ
ncbi:MAG: hypothetical protein N4A49_10285 [Marinifilaceae bacterium]|jgi:hypothetical protein|nr:hypothetical protein [Marinifilaceae bacterium]